MSHIFPRHTKMNPPIAVSGDGAWLIDAEGKRYLDGSCGAAVSCLGHSDKTVVNAIKAQLDKLPFAHTSFFHSEPTEALATLLAENAPAGIDRVYFLSGGSEATETAIKMARGYWMEKGEPQRTRLIARHQSYHGNTIGSLSASGNLGRRAPYLNYLCEMSHIDPCFEYRWREDGESLEDYGLRAAEALKAEIERVGPETVIGFIAEPLVGSTLGAADPAPGYFRRIREICDAYGILLILDEVMCGMGRTGTLFACEQDGIAPDIVCIAKGLGAGYQPIGACLCSAEIFDTFDRGSGNFEHGHTYVGHPAATAAGHAVVSAILERGLVTRVADMGEVFVGKLEARFGQHPHVGNIRGRGFFRGVEIVADRETKAPFDPARGIAGKIKKKAFAKGLICYPGSGTVDGTSGDHVLLAPPFIITEDEMDILVDRLEAAIDAAIAA